MNDVRVELVRVKCYSDKESVIRGVPRGRPRSRSRRVRIYIWQSGTSAVREIATLERYNKPHRELKRLYWREILKRAKLPASTKGVWNPRAGCSCPCSPGFVTDFEGDFSVHVVYRYRRVSDQQVMTRPVSPEMREKLRKQSVI